MKIDACKFPTHDFDKAVIKTNSEGIITEWSANAEKFLGYTVDEILGRNISTIFSNESSTGEKPRTIYEVSAYTKFNQKILVCMEHSLLSNENGTISGFCHTLEYISGDNTLEVKEAIMEAIVNSSNDSIISVTLEGFITSWNPAATTMFGYTELEVIGKNISIIIPAERANEEVFFVSQIKSGKRIDHFETVRIAKDGSEKTIELSISPIRAKDGQIIGISKILQDISYKKEIEEKKAILAAIVDSSDDAIISKTIDGIITSWNHSAKKMFGYSEEEALGKHISIIIPPERIEEETIIIENIRSGNKVDHFETERITKDGTIKNISVTVSPIRNNKGIIIGASKTARDISLRIEAEKQRKLYTERLKELNVYKDEFMVMASHELKTPITVIMANLQILKLLLEEDSKNAFVDKTLKQTLKLSSLIGNLFEVSKIQAGRLVLNITTFDVDKLIKEVVADMQQTTRFHQIVYTGYPGIMVSADIYKFEQVVVNILNNAIKYMPQPGNIYLKLEKTDGSVIFTVSDNGVGIPEKDIESIFERFYRVSGSASSFAGSGVGLYISSEIIKAHGGKIWAESQIGKGSTFYFSIPFV